LSRDILGWLSQEMSTEGKTYYEVPFSMLRYSEPDYVPLLTKDKFVVAKFS